MVAMGIDRHGLIYYGICVIVHLLVLLETAVQCQFKIQVQAPGLAIGNLVNLLGETHAFCSPSQNDSQLQKHLLHKRARKPRHTLVT
jgi:hypothetical protein